MKLLAALLFCCSAFAADRYLVKWETQEKCYECGYTQAVLCGSWTPDCGVPLKTVAHYREFETLKEAVVFANPEPPSCFDTSGFPCSAGILTIIGSQGPRETPLISAKQVVAIYRITEVPIEKGVTRTEVPQPPKIEEKYAITVKP